MYGAGETAGGADYRSIPGALARPVPDGLPRQAGMWGSITAAPGSRRWSWWRNWTAGGSGLWPLREMCRQSQAGRGRWWRPAEREFGALDALVCNAGVAGVQALADRFGRTNSGAGRPVPTWTGWCTPCVRLFLEWYAVRGEALSPCPPCGGSLAAPVRRPIPPPRRG